MKSQTVGRFSAAATAALLTTLLHGCANNPPDNVPLGDDGPGGAGGVQVTPGSGGSSFSGTDLGGSEYQGGRFGDPDDPNNPLGRRIIYFEYDSSDLSPESQQVASAHARYLAEHPRAAVSLEGHTDERGTREYNLALGEQRALSVADLMMLQGASNEQVQTLSYGEERAADLGAGESAWQANRRVEIVYLSE